MNVMDSSRKPQEPTVRLRLAVPQIKARRFSLFWLAQKYSLDVHGQSGLFRVTQMEMGYAALLLTAVFLFDLTLWTYTFQSMFGSALPNLALRIAAGSTGGVLAAFVFILYERQFITNELKGWGPWLGFCVRLVVVAIGAMITARSLHLLVFNGPIQRRQWEQNVRVDAMNQVADLQRAVDFLTGQTVMRYDLLDLQNQIAAGQTNVSEEQRALDQATGDRADADKGLTRALSTLNSLQQQLVDKQKQSRSEPDAVRRGELQTEIANLQGSVQRLTGRIAKLNTDISVADREIIKRQDNIKSLKDGVQLLKTSQLELRKREGLLKVEQWKQRFRRIETGKLPEGPPTLELPPEDFFTKTDALSDLIAGLAPRWPGINAQSVEERNRFLRDKEMLEQQFGIVDRPVSSAQQHAFVMEYWLIFGIGMFVPLMTIAFKAMMPAPLKKYYSSVYQSRLGNPEAIAFERAKDDLL